jgi:hypothetical protein
MVAALTARIGTLEAEFARVEAAAAIHRADFERERERCERHRGMPVGIQKVEGQLAGLRGFCGGRMLPIPRNRVNLSFISIV